MGSDIVGSDMVDSGIVNSDLVNYLHNSRLMTQDSRLKTHQFTTNDSRL